MRAWEELVMELADREAIRDLPVRYCDCVWRGDCTSSEPFGQVSKGFKRGSGPSELKLRLQVSSAAGVVARWFSA